MLFDCELIQATPLEKEVALTTYTVGTLGETTMLGNGEGGFTFQVYVLAPLADKVMAPPIQTELEPMALKLGLNTDMEMVLVF